MKRLIGIDIGSYAIKVLSMKVGRRGAKVKKFGTDKLSKEVIVEGDIIDTNIVESAIRTIFTENNIKNKNLSISIAGRNIMYKNIKVDALGKDEVKKALEWELPNHISYEKENIYTDYEILDEEAGQTDLLIVAAKKDVINSKLTLLKGMGLMPLVVDTEATAVQNAYETLVEPIEDTVFFLDLGANKTSMSIVENGKPRFVREMQQGGNAYTTEIAKNLNVQFDNAENTKIGESKSNMDVAQYFDSLNHSIAADIKKSMKYVQGDMPLNINKGIITGGASQTPGLLDYLKNELNIMDIEIFNPVDYLDIPDEYKKEMEKLGPALSVVCGLAIRKG